MFAKIATVILAAFALALPAIATAPTHCNTGPVQCCNKLLNPDSHDASDLLALVGIAIQGLNGLVGAGCSPITVVGAGTGANCALTPVCCSKNNIKGLVSVGCTPVAVGA